MPLKDLLKKKDRIRDDVTPLIVPAPELPHDPPDVTIMRSDSHTQEIISPPSFAGDNTPSAKNNSITKRLSRLRSASNASTSSNKSTPSGEKRLSQRLHLRHGSRASSQGSINVPADLPDIKDLSLEGEEKEAQWEERATILAQVRPHSRPISQNEHISRPVTPDGMLKEPLQGQSPKHLGDRPRPHAGTRSISSARDDDDIQEAIRLHDAGGAENLERSTAMFGRLAEGNAMAQIMFGLALRHGWGIVPNPALAVQYLSAAASSSAKIESDALASGMKKGGAAKGELVLAIYELANSFRNGWGVGRDAVAARKYYETAANLGDTDAMNEAARCYENGDGGKKDRYTAAQYYRLAEQNGSKTLGNSWIWKDKYNPKPIPEEPTYVPSTHT